MNPSHPPDLSSLMLKFESLGDNCEFGLVQRRAGAEPLGLLRFAFVPMDALLDALRTRFDGVDDIELSIAPNGELISTDRRFRFVTHTWIKSAEVDINRARDRLIRRNRYLRDRLLGQLESAERVLVRKSLPPSPPDDVKTLHEQLRSYGSNTLLWVRLADEHHHAGMVERLDDGLFCGFIDRFAPYDLAARASDDVWIEICRNTLRLRATRSAVVTVVRNATQKSDNTACPALRATLNKIANLLPNLDVIRASDGTFLDSTGRMQLAEPDTPRFDFGPLGHLLGALTERNSANLFAGADGFGSGFRAANGMTAEASAAIPRLRHRAAVIQHEVDRDYSGPVFHHYISGGLVAEMPYCVSAWVWVPSSFTGSVVGAEFNGFPRLRGYSADLSLRDSWQRVWTSARAPPSVTAADPSLVVIGNEDDTIYSTCWQLEPGELPTSYIPTRGTSAERAADDIRCAANAFKWPGRDNGALVWEGSVPCLGLAASTFLRLSSHNGPDISIAVSDAFGLTALLGEKEYLFATPIPPGRGQPFRVVLAFSADGMRLGDSLSGRMTDPVPSAGAVGNDLHLLADNAVHHRRVFSMTTDRELTGMLAVECLAH